MTIKEAFLNKLALDGESVASDFLLSQSVASQLRGDTSFFAREDMRAWAQEIIREDCLGLFKILWNAGWRFDDNRGTICIKFLSRNSSILAYVWSIQRETCLEASAIPHTLEAFLSINVNSDLAPPELLSTLCADPAWRAQIVEKRFFDLVTQDPTWFGLVSAMELSEQLNGENITPGLLSTYINWLNQNQRPVQADQHVQAAAGSKNKNILQVLSDAGVLNKQQRFELSKIKFADQMDRWRLDEDAIRGFYAKGLTFADLDSAKMLELEERVLNKVIPGKYIQDYKVLAKFNHKWKSPRAASVFCKFLPPDQLASHFVFFKEILSTAEQSSRLDLIRLLATGRNEHMFLKLLACGSIDLTKDVDYSLIASYITTGTSTELFEKMLAVREWKLPSLLAVALKAKKQEFITVLVQHGCPLADNVLLAAAQSGDEACVSAALTAKAVSANMLPKLYRIAVVNRQHRLISLFEKHVGKAADLMTLIPQYFKAPEAPLTEET